MNVSTCLNMVVLQVATLFILITQIKEAQTFESSIGKGTNVCKILEGEYVKDAECCNQTTISSVTKSRSYDVMFEKCQREISKGAENQADELPVILWKSYLCSLKSLSAFPNGQLTFNSFVSVLTSNYSNGGNEEIAEKIRNANTECAPADAETEDWKKVLRFAECFYANEKQVCHHPSENALKRMEMKDLLLKNRTVTCSPLEGSMMPYENCCKSMAIPMSQTSMTLRGIMNDRAIHPENHRNLSRDCLKSFRKRLSELNAEDERKSPNACWDACLHTPEPYGGIESLKLDTNLNQSYYYIPDLITPKINEQVLNIFETLKPLKTEVHITSKNATWNLNKTIEYGNLAQEFAIETNEAVKMVMYCAYYKVQHVLVQSAFQRYCE